MTVREKVELVLIAAAASAAGAFATSLPPSLPAGYVILTASVLLLGQGLIRDLWMKYGAKRDHPAPSTSSGQAPSTSSEPPKPQRIVCMCAESTVGVAGVVAGLTVVLCGIRSHVELPPIFWPALVLIVGVIGFIIKDYVLDWKSRSVRRVKDHSSIIPW